MTFASVCAWLPSTYCVLTSWLGSPVLLQELCMTLPGSGLRAPGRWGVPRQHGATGTGMGGLQVRACELDVCKQVGKLSPAPVVCLLMRRVEQSSAAAASDDGASLRQALGLHGLWSGPSSPRQLHQEGTEVIPISQTPSKP